MELPHPDQQLKSYKSIIREKINDHPRSQQQAIGPSELGHGCDRWIGYKMLDFPSVNSGAGGAWRPTVGTAAHTWLDDCFARYPDRFETERKVLAGYIDGEEIWGSADLFDKENGTVVDFKIVGKTTLDKARRGDVDDRYEVQIDAYGVGYLREGFHVRRVSILYLPSSGELDESVFHARDFDPGRAARAFSRVATIKDRVDRDGYEALEDLDRADVWCRRCQFHRPGSTDARVGCPGADTAGSVVSAQDALMSD